MANPQKSASGMLKFPNELLMKICSLLGTEDLLAFRQSHGRACTAATDVMIKRGLTVHGTQGWRNQFVQAWMNMGERHRVTAINFAFPPTIHDIQLTCLNYSIDRLYHSGLFEPPSVPQPYVDDTQYEALCAESMQLRGNRIVPIYLEIASVLGMLSNLQVVQFATHKMRRKHSRVYNSSGQAVSANVRKQVLCHSHAEHSIVWFFKALNKCKWMPTIDEIVFAQLHEWADGIDLDVSMTGQEHLDRIRKVTFCVGGIRAACHTSNDQESERGFLSYLPNIEEAVILSPNPDGFQGLTNLPNHLEQTLIEHVTWPRLTSLTISGFDTQGNNLYYFLEEHKSCLRDLRLGNVYNVELAETLRNVGLGILDGWALTTLTLVGGQAGWHQIFQLELFGDRWGFYKASQYRKTLEILGTWMTVPSACRDADDAWSSWSDYIGVECFKGSNFPWNQHESNLRFWREVVFEKLRIRFANGGYTIESDEYHVYPNQRDTEWDFGRHSPFVLLLPEDYPLEMLHGISEDGEDGEDGENGEGIEYEEDGDDGEGVWDREDMEDEEDGEDGEDGEGVWDREDGEDEEDGEDGEGV